MPNINTTWTPAIGALSQIIESYNKAPLLSAWSSASFSPANPLSPSVNSAIKNIPANSVHRFRVKNTCINGDINTSDISEGIVFQCVPINVFSIEGNTSFTLRANFGASHSVKKMKFLVYNSGGGTLLYTSPDVIIPPGTNLVNHTVSLPTNTTYQVSQILFADLTNGGVTTEVVSNLVNSCKTVITTDYTPIPEAIYARLFYEEPPVGSCLPLVSYTAFRNNKAYIRTFADAACTIPLTPPIGCEVSFEVRALHSKCVTGCEKVTYTEVNTPYTLALNTSSNETLIPEYYKYSDGASPWEDWMYCSSNHATPPCPGPFPPGTLLCGTDLQERDHSIYFLVSSGIVPVTII